jgi:asparagine synthase (glutamine-hydrolysing)
MRGTVPDLVLDRRDKMGFLTAEPAWVRSAHSQQFRDALEDAVEALGAVLHPAILDQFDEVVAGRRPFDQRYWRALSAGRWASVFSVKV